MEANLALQIAKLARKAQRSAKYIDHAKRAYVINLRSTNLASVKSINAAFDPWSAKSHSVRSFAFSMTVPKVKNTNIFCGVHLDVKSDMTCPKLTVNFIDGHKAVFHTENLNRVEIVKIFNSLCVERLASVSSSSGAETRSTNTKPKPKKK